MLPDLSGKKIVLGVTGSIAAYKSALLVRLLIKSGAEVRVVMTPSASDFISPLTLQTLSKHEVHIDISNEASWNNHVELGFWGDLILIAPATANTLAKMAHGICDNLLSATILSAKCPVMVAPAMDLDMWKHPSTHRNLDMLKSDGVLLLPVGAGELASGLYGEGRMAEPEDIVNHLAAFFKKDLILSGKKVLLTAGPTHEAIDPVRFIGNRSSGKMAASLCKSLVSLGAEVELVLGPVSQPELFDISGVNIHQIVSAYEMYEICTQIYPEVHAAFFAAAVADYRVSQPADQKIKKKDQKLSIELVPNPDIAFELGKLKRAGVVHVGFALETGDNGIEAAKHKLKRKQFDVVVLNYAGSRTGFEVNTNQITIMDARGNQIDYPLMEKKSAAEYIIQHFVSFLI